METTADGPKKTLLSKTSGELQAGVARLRGDPAARPRLSIIVPVNAQADLENFSTLLVDLLQYWGEHPCEIIPIVNNYPTGSTPPEIETLEGLGLKVIRLPDARRPGETVSFSARVPGVVEAASENTVHFDADCRIPDVTALLDYYVEQLEAGNMLAYTPVDFYDLPDDLLMRVRRAMHYTARGLKRNFLKIPTPRGSNYAINRSLFLQLYETGRLRDDIQLGPNIKAMGCRHQYGASRQLTVLTSGRRIRRSWLRIFRYVYRRLLFNLRYLRDTEAARSVKKAS